MAVVGNVLRPSTMREGADTIRRAEDGIKTNVVQLDSIFEQIGETWRDDNGTGYVEKYREFKEVLKGFMESCDRLASLQEAVLKAYQENVYAPTQQAVSSATE